MPELFSREPRDFPGYSWLKPHGRFSALSGADGLDASLTITGAETPSLPWDLVGLSWSALSPVVAVEGGRRDRKNVHFMAAFFTALRDVVAGQAGVMQAFVTVWLFYFNTQAVSAAPALLRCAGGWRKWISKVIETSQTSAVSEPRNVEVLKELQPEKCSVFAPSGSLQPGFGEQGLNRDPQLSGDDTRWCWSGRSRKWLCGGQGQPGTPGVKPSRLLHPHVPPLGGDGLAKAPGAEGGDTLAPVTPVEQSTGAKGQD